MDAELLTDADAFEAAARHVLERDPVGANVPATFLARRRLGEALPTDGLWCLLHESGQDGESGQTGEQDGEQDGGHRGVRTIVGVGCQFPQSPLFLAPVPAGREQAAAEAIATAYLAAGRDPVGVAGETAITTAFAHHWQERTGRTARAAMAQFVHVLDTLVDPPATPGAARRATADDVELLWDWFEAFHAEIDPTGPAQDIQTAVSSRVTGGAVMLWETAGRPVGMAGANPPAAGLVRVGPVWTVPEERGRGVAANVTAAVSREALASGARACMLYTDADNPTANGVYTRIGYRLVGEAMRWRFDA